ncbi:hypothetical protein LEMLEM_LOCUS11470, partial [Lemmus lemmus]
SVPKSPKVQCGSSQRAPHPPNPQSSCLSQPTSRKEHATDFWRTRRVRQMVVMPAWLCF